MFEALTTTKYFRLLFYKQLNHLQFRHFRWADKSIALFPFSKFSTLLLVTYCNKSLAAPSTKKIAPYEKTSKFLLFSYRKMFFGNTRILYRHFKPLELF